MAVSKISKAQVDCKSQASRILLNSRRPRSSHRAIMAKRFANAAAGDNEADGGAAAFRKRQKITHHELPAGEDVYSSDQLKNLLAFDQDLHRARHGK